MSNARLTNEFSICLLPDQVAVEQINSLRADLPPSPYRDDVPHITLLRGITASNSPADQELLRDVDSTLDLSALLPVEAKVQRIASLASEMYSPTSLILLEASPSLLEMRRQVGQLLVQHAYQIEHKEQDTAEWIAHMTIRLGVPFQGDMLAKAETLFPAGRVIRFGSWLLFRLMLEDEKRRLMRELRLSN